MTVLSEADLQIELPAGAKGRKFDDQMSHGLSHCMKAVDFIVDLADRILFIEFKDPENPAAPTSRSEDFIKKFLSGSLDADLKTKYRDSFLYEWAAGRAKKPIHYLVLIGASTLTDAELLTRTDALRRELPAVGPGGKAWHNAIVSSCAVMNIAAWNRVLPEYLVSRVSA